VADLTQSAVAVKIKSQGNVGIGLAGESLTQGQPIYQSSGSWYRCDANDTAAKAASGGIVLSPAATSGYFVYAAPGTDVDLGATLTVGETYIVSANVGAIAPIGDLATASYLTILGVATAAGTLKFNPQVSGVQKP
jgi:hypothetical protein